MILKLIVVGLLFITFLQDLRERAVYILLFPLLLIGFTAISLYSQPVSVLAGNYLLNFLFLVIQMVLLYAYFTISRGKPTVLIGTLIGWGDILFWLVTAALFSPANYILYFLASLVFALAFHFFISLIAEGGEPAKVPLAGNQALFLMAALILQLFYPALNFYSDDLLLESWL